MNLGWGTQFSITGFTLEKSFHGDNSPWMKKEVIGLPLSSLLGKK